ncbi:MAG: antibiotic biosynthesis monooxygenase [Longimonas sp.]|uniref:putative quinol monooxygenase n=1 Tax=Longimonas sp. TaxID=2039626 RepID=UPI0039762A76
MLIRIVRLTLAPSRVAEFHAHFQEVAPRIRQVEGCRHLELWTDATYPNVVITHSHWTNDDALQAYRHSEVFRTAWSAVKPLFAARPEAFSATVAHPASAIAAAQSSA